MAFATFVTLVVTSGAAGKSDVADAAMRGDKAAVQKLITQKVDVNAPQNDGATALHWAVYRGDKELVAMLVRAGANPKAANRQGSTPLWLASINGDAAIIAGLLEAGADANEKLPLGRTPLMIAARTGNVDAIKTLLDNGAEVNAKETQRGTTPLMWAADEGHSAAVQLLIERGADIKAKSNPAPRGRGPALGKANDPRKAVAAQGAALAAGNPVSQILRDGDTPNNAGRGGRNGGRGGNAGGGGRGGADSPTGAAGDDQQDDAAAAVGFTRGRQAPIDGGGLTPLIYAARANDIESVKVLLAAGADINQTTAYGWSPLLVATQNRYYKLGAYLLERGADPNLGQQGWMGPPVHRHRQSQHRERRLSGAQGRHGPPGFIKLLLDKGANVNARVKDSTETRTVFTNQWLDENGATAFLRASQSGDVELMKLLLSRGADPKINTLLNVTPLHVAAGIGWVEGITYEWSQESTLAAVKMLLDLGLEVNLQADTGRTAMHGAAHKGRSDVVQALFDKGGRVDIRDFGNTDNRGGKLAVHTWQPVDYADGLVRVGVQSAIGHPDTGLLLRKLMTQAGFEAPPMGRTLESICITEACDTGQGQATDGTITES